jgi:hypothetical protein
MFDVMKYERKALGSFEYESGDYHIINRSFILFS